VQDDLLVDWVDGHSPDWKLKGLLLRGRDYPVTGRDIEFDEHGEVWLLKSDDGECLVIRPSQVIGVQVEAGEKVEG